MTDKRESPEETRARLLYMQLRAGGWSLTKAQYCTCKGWIAAGQLERAERFMQIHGIMIGGAGA